MKDSVIRRYLETPKPEEVPVESDDGLDNLGAFGFLRGTHDKAIMLELHLKDGTIESFNYAWLARATFEPSEGIRLHFSGTTVKIIGRHLNAELRQNVRLFSAIARHRVPWIRVVDEARNWQADRNTTVVEQIRIE
jgi:hypothetical protein